MSEAFFEISPTQLPTLADLLSGISQNLPTADGSQSRATNTSSSPLAKFSNTDVEYMDHKQALEKKISDLVSFKNLNVKQTFAE